MNVFKPMSLRHSIRETFRILLWRLFCMTVVFTEIWVIFAIFVFVIWSK